jgi:hypothetical protein
MWIALVRESLRRWMHYMVEELDDPAANRSVIVPCANCAHSRVFQAEMAKNKVLQHSPARLERSRGL